MSSNSQSGSPVLVIIGGTFVMLYIAASVLLSGGNTMGSMFFYMLIFSGVLGIIAPRKAFFLFLFQCGYLDLAKRLMVMAGDVGVEDLYWVLGIAPITVCGITAGLVIRIFYGQIPAGRSDVLRLCLAVCIITAGALITYKGGGGFSSVAKTVTDAYLYSLLVFVVPLLFSTTLEVRRLWNVVFLIFVPVAIYGIYQQLVGFQEFELEYLRTGLSIEIKQLYTERVRAFSTLNSPTSLSLIMSELAAVVALLSGTAFATRFKRHRFKHGFPILLAITLFCLFCAAWLASTVRVGIMVVPISITAVILFRGQRSTFLFYLFSILFFASLIAVAPYILMNIEAWTMRMHEWVGDNEFMANLLDANTYKDRLMGFVNVLGNPDAYTLLGKGGADTTGEFYNHDPLSNALLKFGVLPLACILLGLSKVLIYLHQSIWRIADHDSRRMATICLAVVAGSVAVSMVGGNLISSFPGNVFLTMPIGMVLAIRGEDERRRKEQSAQNALPVPTSQWQRPWALGRPAA